MMRRVRLPALPGLLAVALLVMGAAGATFQVQHGRAVDAEGRAATIQGGGGRPAGEGGAPVL